MDIHLSGMTALQRLRADPVTAAMRVVALMAFAMKEGSQRFLGAGFDGYVVKPIAIRELPVPGARLPCHRSSLCLQSERIRSSGAAGALGPGITGR